MVVYDLNSGEATSLELCKDDVILSVDVCGNEIAAGSMGSRNELFIVERLCVCLLQTVGWSAVKGMQLSDK